MNEPTVAYLTLENGERVDCLLEKVDDNEWQATPVTDVNGGDIVEAYVDVLPGEGSISFILYFEEDEETEPTLYDQDE